MQERISRQVAYKETSKDISKWTPIIKANRLAESLSFPLDKEPRQRSNNAELVQKFTPKTKMELEIEASLQENKMANSAQIKEEEDLKMNHLSIEEVQQRREELQKMRSLLFFEERKLKRAAKIKSKSYHRIKKRERERLAKKAEIDADQEEARKERLDFETQRAKERISLRHGVSKTRGFKKNQVDKNSQRALNEQLRRHEELRSAIKGGSDTEESQEESEAESSPSEREMDDDEFEEAVKKDAAIFADLSSEDEEVFERKPKLRESKKVEVVFSDVSDEEVPDLGFKSLSEVKIDVKSIPEKRKQHEEVLKEEALKEEDLIEEAPKTEFDFNAQRELIERAFATDNVIQSFLDEKEAEDEEASEPEELPGWGSWSGKGLLPRPREQTVKKAIKRQDSKLKHVIINEKTSKQLKYTVAKVPYPYTNKQQYDRKMMVPIGKEWNATTTFQKRIKPNVEAEVGAIIKPIKYKKQPKK